MQQVIPGEVTALLDRIAGGDRSAWNEMLPMIYGELRARARRQMRSQPFGGTLQPTALVHELWSRFAQREGPAWNDREHFLAVAATAMRGILVDHARERAAAKRGGEWQRVTVSSGCVADAGPDLDLLDLDGALEELTRLNPRHAQVVTLRFFGGLTVDSIASTLGVSRTTVESDWRLSRAWLSMRLQGGARG